MSARTRGAAMIRKILGPPGTGKTTTIIEMLRGYAEEHELGADEFLATAYTRAAIQALRQKLRAAYMLPPPKRARYVIASLEQILWRSYDLGARFWTPAQKVKFFSDMGLKYNANALDYDAPQTEELAEIPAGNVIEAGWAKALMRSTPDTWHGMAAALGDLLRAGEIPADYPVQLAVDTWNAYLAVSRKTNRYDYSFAPFMYLQAPDEGLQNFFWDKPKKLLIVDEAQDMSDLGWDWIRRAVDYVDDVWLVGDDDQALLEFLGARPALFIRVEADHHETLGQTYRYGGDVYALAHAIVSRVSERVEKPYEPAPRDSRVLRVRTAEGALRRALAANESVMLLHRHRRGVQAMRKLLVARHLRRVVLGKTDTLIDEPGKHGLTDIAEIISAAQALYDVTDREYLVSRVGFPVLARAYLGVEVDTQDRAVRLGRIEERLPALRPLVRADARRGFERLAAALRWSDDKRKRFCKYFWEYFFERGLRPRAAVGTIHASKGLEADAVILSLEATRKVARRVQGQNDEELRVWYVGVTRARHELYLIGEDNIGFSRFLSEARARRKENGGL